jgi:hypothetical protein
MATPIIRKNSIIGIEEEVSEGTYLAPQANTSYIQPLEEGFDMNMARELLDRGLLTSAPGKETPRLGMRSVTATLPVEYRGSGTEGAQPDFHPLLKSALGGNREIAAQVTSKNVAHTALEIEIEDADIGNFSVGDVVCVLESGAHEVRPISAIDSGAGTASITFPFALDNGAPSNAVVISKSQMYYTASTGHPALSLSYYWANEIRQAATGAKVTSLSLDNYTVGQVSSLNFGLEGLFYEDEADGVAPHTPSYDSGIPPILLKACVFRDGVSIPVNTLTLSLANTLGFTTSLCSENGKISSRVVSREITGSLNPYKDDTSTDYFDDWDAGTEFSLFAYAFNPSSTAGEFDLGSICSIWLPQCLTTEFQTQDLEGLLVDQMSFRATRGSDGTEEEMYLSLI